jgi:Tol biopolymer transport system component
MHPATRGASLLILTVACVAVGALVSPSAGAGKPTPAAPEGFAATLVAPGVISTEADEVGAAFTPDMRTLYFTRRSPTTSTPTVSVIFVSRFEKGRWGAPEVASFSGRYRDSSPAISPDGSRLFFFSYRPREPGGKPKADADLWVVDATDAARDRWSEPRNLGSPVNTDSNEGSPSVAADGTLYFFSDREGGRGGFDIYRARPAGAGFAEPENLGEAINTGATETHPTIAPDQNLLVFVSFGRPEIPLSGGFPYPCGDLYASVRKDGVWEQARNLGAAVNTTATESNPSLAPDGRRLFFISERGFASVPMPAGLTHERFQQEMRGSFNGRGNLYEIPLSRVGLRMPGESTR